VELTKVTLVLLSVAEPPVQVRKMAGLLTKFAPLSVRLTRPGRATPVTGLGLTLLIDGAGAPGATTWNPAEFEFLPSGLVALTVQLSAVTLVATEMSTRVELTNVTLVLLRVAEPPVHVRKMVGLLTKFEPLSVRLTRPGRATPVTGFGLTLLIEGDGALGASTWKPAVFEFLPSGFVALTVQLSAVTSVATEMSTRVELTKVTLELLSVAEPPVQVTNMVGLLTKFEPLSVRLTRPGKATPVTGFGLTLLIDGDEATTSAKLMLATHPSAPPSKLTFHQV